MTKKKLTPISVTNLETDSAFKKWIGTSPIEINGVNNRIGYWTLKSWLSIPENRRSEGSDNEIRYRYAREKFNSFERALRAEKKQKTPKQKKKKRRRREDKVKQLLARKNWGLPREVFEKVGVVIEKVDVSEEDVSVLATEIKQAFKSPTHKFFPGESIASTLGLGSAKAVVKLVSTFYSLSKEKGEFMSPEEKIEKVKLRESNPEVRTSKKYVFAQNLAGFILVPAISKIFMGLGWLGLSRILYNFFEKSVHFTKVKGFAGLSASSIAGVGAFFTAITLTYVIYRILFQKYIIPKKAKKLKEEKDPHYDTTAAQIVMGYQTPKKLAKQYQSRVNLILQQDIDSNKKKRLILELWSEFQNDIAPSIDKGEYLRGYQEGASYKDFLKRGSVEDNEGFNFFLGFKSLTQRIELEEDIPSILEENKSEIIKEMEAIIRGDKKLPAKFLNSVRASLQT